MKSFGDMVKQAQKMQTQMAELQEKLAEERFEASAGGGMVQGGRRRQADAQGDQDQIPRRSRRHDVTLLEDLIITAVGEAQRSLRGRR